MAATATSTGTGNWSADATWAITGIGTASGADGVLVSGVLTPTVSPAWTAGALVGRRMKLDAVWYSVSANTETTATITSPPADATYAYLLGGSPLATDVVIVATGHIVALDVVRAPATASTFASLTGTGTGQITVALTTGVTREIFVAGAVQAGTKPTAEGLIVVAGSAGTFNLTCTTATAGTNTSASCIVHNGTSAATVNVTGNIVGGSANYAYGMNITNSGPWSVTGNITGGSAGSAAAGLTNAYTGAGTINGPSTISGGGAITCYGVNNAYTGVITLDAANGGVDLVNSANVTAWIGKPPVWKITGRANYISWPTVNLDGAGNAIVRFVVLPTLGTVTLNTVLCSGGASYIGTRVDCPVGKAVTSSGNYGNPASPLVGTISSSIVDADGVVTAAPGILDADGARTAEPGILDTDGAAYTKGLLDWDGVFRDYGILDIGGDGSSDGGVLDVDHEYHQFGIISTGNVFALTGVREADGTVYTLTDGNSTPYTTGATARLVTDTLLVAAKAAYILPGTNFGALGVVGSLVLPNVKYVYNGVDRGDGTTGTLRASNLHSGAGAPGVNLTADILQHAVVVDDVTGTGEKVLITITDTTITRQ